MAIASSTSSSTMRVVSHSRHHHNNHHLEDDDNHERRLQPPAAEAEGGDDDGHEQDVVMPGFRFHPTEEELVEFYLRRKVEGKPFNVELITFLDLYRYDPWELPGLAAIGEKEWYFYVPRDRKYRNGDRPNRVTTSGYWKATGADRMIKTDGLRSIGLKKTLVFYSGKAPKGIRTSWIMNEYRLPHHETERFQKAEISLCRVYKRAGVDDHPSLPPYLPITSSSSRASHHHNSHKNKDVINNQLIAHQNNLRFLGHHQYHQTDQVVDKVNHQTEENSTTSDHHHHDADANKYNMNPQDHYQDEGLMLRHQQQQAQADQHTAEDSINSSSLPSNDENIINGAMMVGDSNLNRQLSYNHQQLLQYYNNIYAPPPPPPQTYQQYYQQPHHIHQFSNNNIMLPQSSSQQQQSSTMAALHNNSLPINSFSDRLLWEWNPIPEASNRDFTTMSFK